MAAALSLSHLGALLYRLSDNLHHSGSFAGARGAMYYSQVTSSQRKLHSFTLRGVQVLIEEC